MIESKGLRPRYYEKSVEAGQRQAVSYGPLHRCMRIAAAWSIAVEARRLSTNCGSILDADVNATKNILN